MWSGVRLPNIIFASVLWVFFLSQNKVEMHLALTIKGQISSLRDQFCSCSLVHAFLQGVALIVPLVSMPVTT